MSCHIRCASINVAKILLMLIIVKRHMQYKGRTLTPILPDLASLEQYNLWWQPLKSHTFDVAFYYLSFSPLGYRHLQTVIVIAILL